MFPKKVKDHRKTVRFGFVTSKPKIREFHCAKIYKIKKKLDRKKRLALSYKFLT